MQQLQTTELSAAQLALMRPLHQRGAKETKRQRLSRALRMQRAGGCRHGGSNAATSLAACRQQRMPRLRSGPRAPSAPLTPVGLAIS